MKFIPPGFPHRVTVIDRASPLYGQSATVLDVTREDGVELRLDSRPTGWPYPTCWVGRKQVEAAK